MDDRAALAIATAVGERLAAQDDLPCEVWLASTVQEENGLLGAASLADELTFDCAIAIDVGLTGDIPGPDKRDFPCSLGAGPIVVFQDASCHYSRRLSDALIGAARANDIPVQRAVFQNYGSDGAALIRRGVDTALITYPTRYTHSPIETVDEGDLRHTVDLLVAFINGDYWTAERRNMSELPTNASLGHEGSLQDALEAVRALDPTATDEAVARFLAEIAEAESALAAIDPGLDAFPGGFSPAWPESAEQ